MKAVWKSYTVWHNAAPKATMTGEHVMERQERGGAECTSTKKAAKDGGAGHCAQGSVRRGFYLHFLCISFGGRL